MLDSQDGMAIAGIATILLADVSLTSLLQGFCWYLKLTGLPIDPARLVSRLALPHGGSE